MRRSPAAAHDCETAQQDGRRPNADVTGPAPRSGALRRRQNDEKPRALQTVQTRAAWPTLPAASVRCSSRPRAAARSTAPAAFTLRGVPPRERVVDVRPTSEGSPGGCPPPSVVRFPSAARSGALGARAVDEHLSDRRSGVRTAPAALARLDQLDSMSRRRQVKVLW